MCIRDSIYEGTLLSQSYTFTSQNPNQRFVLPNIGVDTRLINIKAGTTNQKLNILTKIVFLTLLMSQKSSIYKKLMMKDMKYSSEMVFLEENCKKVKRLI